MLLAHVSKDFGWVQGWESVCWGGAWDSFTWKLKKCQMVYLPFRFLFFSSWRFTVFIIAPLCMFYRLFLVCIVRSHIVSFISIALFSEMSVHAISKISNSRCPYLQKIWLGFVSIFSYIIWSISVINTVSGGPYLVTFLEVPEQNPKSIAIHPESLISHLGII